MKYQLRQAIIVLITKKLMILSRKIDYKNNDVQMTIRVIY